MYILRFNSASCCHTRDPQFLQISSTSSQQLRLYYAMKERQEVAEAAVFDQTNILPKKQMLTVFAALAVSLFISFVDQNGIGVAMPTIGKELRAEATISWAGTSALIANTIFQVLYGRLSDLFGQPHTLNKVSLGANVSS